MRHRCVLITAGAASSASTWSPGFGRRAPRCDCSTWLTCPPGSLGSALNTPRGDGPDPEAVAAALDGLGIRTRHQPKGGWVKA